MLTRKKPLDQTADEFLIPQKSVPKDGPAKLIKLMKKMYQDDPEKRPAVTYTIQKLEGRPHVM